MQTGKGVGRLTPTPVPSLGSCVPLHCDTTVIFSCLSVSCRDCCFERPPPYPDGDSGLAQPLPSREPQQALPHPVPVLLSRQFPGKVGELPVLMLRNLIYLNGGISQSSMCKVPRWSWRYTCDVQKLPTGRRRASRRDAEHLRTLPVAEYLSHSHHLSQASCPDPGT